MWTTDSGRWIFPLTLAVVMIVSISQAASFIPPKCCPKVNFRMHKFKECFELKKGYYCNKDAYLIRNNKKDDWLCIDHKFFERSTTIKCDPAVSSSKKIHRG